MYNIESRSIREFVMNNKIKFPRFQRRGVWDDKQNFELCVSIFQDYPVGVVIVNETRDTTWLLDGRQRLTALRQMRENPINVYNWAMKYIGFKKTEDSADLQNKYWAKLRSFLNHENSGDSRTDNASEDNSDEIFIDSNDYDPESSIDSTKQREGLTTLLNSILMIHQITRDGLSRWEKIFDFREYCDFIPYVSRRNGGKIDPISLRSFILEYTSNNDYDQETFIEFCEQKFGIKDNYSNNLHQTIKDRWSDIKKSCENIKKSEDVFVRSTVGMIKLTNVTNLDAQIIFSRINKNGTPLTPEELLSAKPYWNVEVSTSDQETKTYISTLYKVLKVEPQANIVRWDLAATLISRLRDKNFIFNNKPSDKEEDELMLKAKYGFKLIASYFYGGMSSKVVNDIENKKDNNPAYKLEDIIDDFVDDLNIVLELLQNMKLFKYFMCWNRSIQSLLGDAIAFEFVTIMLKNWKDLGKPRTESSSMKSFRQNAYILFDRLVYEYANRAWSGSGDSKMANHIANESYTNRFEQISQEDWKNLIKNACDGTISGQDVKYSSIAPIIYYYNSLREFQPTNRMGYKYDVDHIYPQSILKDNASVDQKLKDSLFNLALLAKPENISKSDQLLKDISDSWLKTQISNSSEIPESEFVKYSDVNNLVDLRALREPLFIKVFSDKRNAELANPQ